MPTPYNIGWPGLLTGTKKSTKNTGESQIGDLPDKNGHTLPTDKIIFALKMTVSMVS